MRSRLLLLPFLLALAPAPLALADDPPQEKKKVDLVYRWDLLDGKTAVYDVSIVTSYQRDYTITTEVVGEGDPEKEKANEDRFSYWTKQKSRLRVSFARADGQRCRVTSATERVELTWKQNFAGEQASFTYDSANPPKGDVPKLVRDAIPVIEAKLQPRTVVVSRRGLVESGEGIPSAALQDLKNAFLLFPDTPRAEGEGWTRNLRTARPPYGAIVTKRVYKLTRVDESSKNSLAVGGEWRIDGTSLVEFEAAASFQSRDLDLRIDGDPGSQRVVLDSRGLQLEEEINETIEVTERKPESVKRQKTETSTRSTLVELRDPEKK
ncbi:hypothetical protein HY251_09595 [bacterium]|nr:hypothetical protein [bacterium]